ncbi:hypothetical protein DAPPUDRAFT_309638 [Daphnia pulex]|uniref:Uncharacterized protein n=1 Tax=Daphnia pulex TaxID=6669 RepID=E9FS34_DAPPU|nr:hypothetical protein DAPPUDRAFT_309638 [Daphnia pulex]|eukprot:EFX89964.1 hypothetical protein DAPPUDRAFT_309638 [Daphnia pulex]
MTSCLLTSGIPRLTSNAMLWKRLGLNRGIGNERPQITSSKKKGESTVYFIKLPPQPHYYSAFNLLPTSNDQKNTPEPFETVSVDFTANGKPENVYHWNLPLGLTHPTTTTTTTTTTPHPPTSTHSPLNYKKPYRHNYYNNGKPHKLYFVKPSYRAPATTVPTAINPTTTTETPPSSSTIGFYKKLQFKKNFKGNGKPNQLYFVQPAHFSF